MTDGKIRVYLVDDQAIVGEAIRRMLESETDIEFVYSPEPQKALPRAVEVLPTVILQDLVMPDIDGLTLVRYFRAHPKLGQVPIIVLSSKEDPRDKSQAFTAGASDYLVKIPDKIELVARIRSHARAYLAQCERDAAYQALEKLRAELEEKNEELRRLTAIDGLTGIANRRRFDEALKAEWARGQRNRSPLSLVLIDIDYFKLFNDGYGHVAGDECLRRVARAIASAPRRPADLAARYGGEEFALLLPDTSLDGAEKVAQMAKDAVAKCMIAHAGSKVAEHVTISQGIACFRPSPDASTEKLVECADAALYETKKNGRNGYRSTSSGSA